MAAGRFARRHRAALIGAAIVQGAQEPFDAPSSADSPDKLELLTERPLN